MTKRGGPPQKSGHEIQHPDYAAMAEAIEKVAGELAARAEAESDDALAAQSQRLLQLAAMIRSDAANSG